MSRHNVSLKMTDDEHAMLEGCMHLLDLSKSDAIREAIRVLFMTASLKALEAAAVAPLRKIG